MEAGYVTVQESDAYLEFQIGSDAWFDSETIAPQTGTVRTGDPVDPSTAIVGTGTAFNTDLAVADYLESDYQLAQIGAITDDESLTLSAALKILEDQPYYKLTAAQYARRKPLYRKKIQALVTAYRRLQSSVDLSETTETPQQVKDAQCVLALYIFKRPNNTHQLNQANGIKREKVGDMETEYEGRIQKLPPEVVDLLGDYYSENQIVQMTRRGMDMSDDSVLIDPLGFNIIP